MERRRLRVSETKRPRELPASSESLSKGRLNSGCSMNKEVKKDRNEEQGRV